MSDSIFRLNPPINNIQLNNLFSCAQNTHVTTDFEALLHHSLFYICAYSNNIVIGFVKVVWDGGEHGFLLDTTVQSNYQRQGIGLALVQKAIEYLREKGLKWLHVDYEPHLHEFYTRCRFLHTKAGLLDLKYCLPF